MEATPQFDDVKLSSQDSTGDESFHVILARKNDPAVCTFWVSLYKQGTVTTQQFLSAANLDEAFSTLSNEGIAESKALMLSDNSGGVPRQYFLLPEVDFRRNPAAVKSLILATLKDLNLDRVGFYFSPSLLGLDASVRTVSELLKGLSLLRTKESHLYTGEIGVSKLLNAALHVKEEIRTHRDIWIFH